MKKTLILLILLLVGFLSFADEPQSILDLTFEMELGYLPQNGWVLHETDLTTGTNFYDKVTVELILLNTFFAGFNMRSDFSDIPGSYQFDPTTITYGINVGFRFGNFEIGFRHYCFHPVITYIRNSTEETINAEGGYEEIYIKFKGKVKIF